MNVIDLLEERGFIESKTHEKELMEIFEQNSVSCYIGFDPTASSLHIGSLVPIMALSHMQKQGHKPIALVGGGTGLIGDPSGKTEMRKLITSKDIEFNKVGIKKQLSNFLDFDQGNASMVDNADWLTELQYITFLRDIGRFFSVNRMIKAESYKMRLDSDEGLNFIEFNYMLLQSFDFLKLFEDYDCVLQMGGSDQWGNIVAGIELIRRKLQKTAYGITFPLITTSSGAKMGKTAKGAVWLDSARTSPYEYYQYWINTDDKDVARFLSLFTFLPMNEIQMVKKFKGSDLNIAKTILAFETTNLAHGIKEAKNALKASVAMFGERAISKEILPSSAIHKKTSDGNDLEAHIPHSYISIEKLEDNLTIVDLFCIVKLSKSKSEARRLIEQGGGYVNNERIESYETYLTSKDFMGNQIILRAGKKRYHKIILEK